MAQLCRICGFFGIEVDFWWNKGQNSFFGMSVKPICVIIQQAIKHWKFGYFPESCLTGSDELLKLAADQVFARRFQTSHFMATHLRGRVIHPEIA
jgi:hypothetical protein